MCKSFICCTEYYSSHCSHCHHLTRLLRSPSAELCLSALWVFRNLIYKCATETKHAIMVDMGWPMLNKHLDDTDSCVHEQALNSLCNFADCENDDSMRSAAHNYLVPLRAPSNITGCRCRAPSCLHTRQPRQQPCATAKHTSSHTNASAIAPQCGTVAHMPE